MKTLAKLVAANLLAFAPFAASAQAASICPALPSDAGLHWEQLDGPGFLFCRALAEDGSEAFAVTISHKSPFKPSRSHRAETGSVAGQSVHWYRSEIAGTGTEIARETLVELGDDDVAHISLRAANDGAKDRAMQQVQALQFDDVRLSSN